MGRGDDVLGQKLLGNFIGTLKELGKELWRLILLNGGVKLSIEGSDGLSTLRTWNETESRYWFAGPA